MSSESFSQQSEQEIIAERREGLKENLGIALCSKQKDGSIVPLLSQIEFAQRMNLPSVQFDFMNRAVEEIELALDVFIEYRKSHPDTVLSIHGETLQIDEDNAGMKNRDRLLHELELTEKLGGESFTVHPPSINSGLFGNLPKETHDKVLDHYCSVFTDAMKHGIKLTVAVENMPVKGDNGAWGQNVSDIIFLIGRLEQAFVKAGLSPDDARARVGATLDVNHALHGADINMYETILTKWFQGLGEYLTVVHLYTPSEITEEFLEKQKLSLELASRFSPNARLFLESKQDMSVTKELYAKARSVD